MLKRIIIGILLLGSVPKGISQEIILPLWPEDVPNRKGSGEKELVQRSGIIWITNVQEPEITVYLPSAQQATGQAVVICPGGAYGGLAYDWEGTDMAKWLNSKGIAGIVLKYRLPDSALFKEAHKAPLEDVQRAVRLVRENSGEWNIENHKVGVLGFSAGGHLAASLATHFETEESNKNNLGDAISSRPDFVALIYPVITMQNEFTHSGSRTSLLGERPSEELVREFSNELQVKDDTPPVILVHATDDKVVPVENSLMFYKALKEKNIFAEMHIYPEGGHGFSLAVGKNYLSSWPERLHDWLVNLDYREEIGEKPSDPE